MFLENLFYIIECILNFVESNAFVFIPLLLFCLFTFLNTFKNVSRDRLYNGFCGNTLEKIEENTDEKPILQDWEIQINKYVR